MKSRLAHELAERQMYIGLIANIWLFESPIKNIKFVDILWREFCCIDLKPVEHPKLL